MYKDDDDVQHSVRQHHGRHDHARPPIKSLPAADRAALDQQVRENPQLTAQQLRAGAGATQVPLGEINPILLGARKARTEVENSKVRQGIVQPGATRNSGFQLLDSLSSLQESFETPWIVKSDLMDGRFIVMQTPFMREALLQDQIRSWREEVLVAESGRHGVVTDGCHDFFKQGILLISLVFSQVMMRWAPVLYTWIGKFDTAHHKSHFDQLVYVIAEMCTRGLGYAFDERLYSAILDFSSAQRNGFIESFVDFMCARIPGWNTLSEQSRTSEAANLRSRAEALIQGCIVHWKRSLHKIKQTIRSQFLYRFETLVGILEADSTTAAQFLETVEILLTEFPEIRPWLSWWILPGNGSMIFPAMRKMPAELQARLPHSTNAAESGHWLLYRAVGSGFDLWEGIRRLYRFQREIEMLYAAIQGISPLNLSGSKPQAKSRLKWHENDGRAPDTRERLAAVQKLEAEFAMRNAALTDEERWIAVNSAPAIPASTQSPPMTSTPPTALVRQSYVWDSNSCFIDAPLEAYFRAFVAMGDAARTEFLRRIRTETPATGLRDVVEHFWLRGLLCGAITSPSVDLQPASKSRSKGPSSDKGVTKPSHKKLGDALLAGQLNVKRLIETKWDGGVFAAGMASCSRTWLNQMVNMDTTNGVKKYFGISNTTHYLCGSKHSSTSHKPEIWSEIGIHFNDIRIAQQFIDPQRGRPLLDDYLMHAIPRERCSTSRTTTYRPLHIGPPIPCPHLSCKATDASISSISTEWPLILRIDPINRHHFDPPMPDVACPLTLSLGKEVEYQLIARVIYIPPNGPGSIGHYVTKARVKDKTYFYNDLRREGLLTELGPLYLLEEHDADTSFVVYLRTSKASTTSRTTEEIQEDFSKIPTPPKEYVTVLDDSDDEMGIQSEKDDEIDKMLLDLITSPTKESRPRRSYSPPPDSSQDRFYTPEEDLPMPPIDANEMVLERSFAETDSQTPCPIWCDGCGMQQPEGDAIFEEVQCEKCRYWSHMDCLPSGVNWNDENVHFVCKRCRDADPLADILWPGQIAMVPDPNVPDWKAPGVLWYPATFIKRHRKAAPHDEYEFRWFECTDGTVYWSEDSALPPLLLRRFCRSRKFFEEINAVKLRAKQMNNLHRQTKIFEAAVPLVARILVAFEDRHPVVRSFTKYFSGKNSIDQHRAASDWMRTLDLVPTPELEAVLSKPLITLLGCEALSDLLQAERDKRVMGVGSVLLQLLAVQRELGEALNLNGDIVEDLITGRVVRCPSDGPAALAAMFAAIPLTSVQSGILTQRMLKFNADHATYDRDYRPPTYRRDDPSIFKPTAAIPVLLKREGSAEIEGEKPAKRAKTAKKDVQKKSATKKESKPRKREAAAKKPETVVKGSGRRLRSGTAL
ncbi:hypothetical protein B0H11DRAFT_2231915 [Mycena galericulata]|nr:hypothetical protein B0H11DRAFT_2231915 [Mycena galericulata]